MSVVAASGNPIGRRIWLLAERELLSGQVAADGGVSGAWLLLDGNRGLKYLSAGTPYYSDEASATEALIAHLNARLDELQAQALELE